MKVALAVAVVLIACAGPTQPPAVWLTVDAREHTLGDTLALVLANGTATDIGYHLCSVQLERRVDVQWTAVQSGGECPEEHLVLGVGDTASVTWHFSGGFDPGVYRAVVTVWGVGGLLDDGTRVASAPFRVRAEPPPN
jgi:hypothetical protein